MWIETGKGQPVAPLLAFAILVVCGLFLICCVSSAEGRRMRQDIDTLNARFEEVSASLNEDAETLSELITTAETEIAELGTALEDARLLLQRNSADLGLELTEFGEEIDVLRGDIEQADFRLDQIQQQLNLFMEYVDTRLD